MSREIKYKVFFYDGEDNSTGEFLSIEQAMKDGIVWFDMHSLKCDENCSVILEFTGLKDKNGKDVFEGDVLKGNSGRFHEVVWQGSSWCMKNNFFGIMLIKHTILLGFEVIGSIHENPELLK